MKAATLVIYGVFGTLAVVLGALVLVQPGLALPREGLSPFTAHLVREEGALGIFVGLMAFWCVSHFEQRRPVHFALLLFAALFGAIHWLAYFSGERHLLSPVINSLPFLAFAVTIPRVRG